MVYSRHFVKGVLMLPRVMLTVKRRLPENFGAPYSTVQTGGDTERPLGTIKHCYLCHEAVFYEDLSVNQWELAYWPAS
jgi:hypothetical protein